MSSMELVPLLCVRCSTPVPAAQGESAWVCTHCGQGLLLAADGKLEAITANFAAGRGMQGRPYWVAMGSVSLPTRDSYSRFSLFGLGNQAPQAQQFWAAPRRFFIPAYDADLQTLVAEGVRLLRQPPELRAGTRMPHLSVTLARDDVRPIAEYIVLALEAERRDKVRQLEFTLELQMPDLWIVP